MCLRAGRRVLLLRFGAGGSAHGGARCSLSRVVPLKKRRSKGGYTRSSHQPDLLRRGAAPPSPVGVAAQSAAHKLCTQRAAPHHRGDSCIRGPLLPHAPPQQKLESSRCERRRAHSSCSRVAGTSLSWSLSWAAPARGRAVRSLLNRHSSSQRATPRWRAASRGHTCRRRPRRWPARARAAGPAPFGSSPPCRPKS